MKHLPSLLLALLGSSVVSQCATEYKVIARYPVPGSGGWDYVTLDVAARRLYISHATQVEVLDADNGKPVGVIPNTPGVHGIAITKDSKRGYTSNGRENKVSVFDPSTLRVIKKVDVGKGPDGIYFDPASNRVFTNNHGSHDVTRWMRTAERSWARSRWLATENRPSSERMDQFMLIARTLPKSLPSTQNRCR